MQNTVTSFRKICNDSRKTSLESHFLFPVSRTTGNALRYIAFVKTTLKLMIYIHMIFDGLNTTMIFVLLMIGVKEFVSYIVTSLTLYVSISRFRTMLTKNSLKVLARAFSDVITVDFSIREIVIHVLTLFPNNGFTKLLHIGDIM